MSEVVQIERFLNLSESAIVLDVRTPAEFGQGHIPGAINIPLFSNEERKIVGTIYKQEGRQQAILKGLELVGPKQKNILSSAIKANKNNHFLLYCWRGGMRSSSIAWLLELYGFKVYLLKGGYKSFRKHVLQSFLEKREIVVIGGKTGSNKTEVLHELQRLGEQTIDLESLAHHKGSSFGAIGELTQPSQEQFENELSIKLNMSDKTKRIWIEDESRLIGHKVIPEGLWVQMRNSMVIYLDISFEERVKTLTRLYGKYPKNELVEAIGRIKKRLGPQHAKAAIEEIEQGHLSGACQIILHYYDKTYDYGISKREQKTIIKYTFEKKDSINIAKEIMK